MKILKTINLLLLFFEIFLCVGGFIGFQITFGHGLGDLIDFAFLYLLTIIHCIWTYVIRKSITKKFILPIAIFICTTFIFCLKATIWRGSEYSWENGGLFYGRSENEENGVTTTLMYEITSKGKTDFIESNGLDEIYISTIKVSKSIADNEFVKVDSGYFKVPDTLRQFTNNMDNKRLLLKGQNPFEKDGKLVTKTIVGQIVGLKDSVFIFFVNH